MAITWTGQTVPVNPLSPVQLTVYHQPSDLVPLSSFQYPRETGTLPQIFTRKTGSERTVQQGTNVLTNAPTVTNPSDTSAQTPVASDFDKLLGFAQGLLGGGGSGSGQPQYQIIPGSGGGGSPFGLILILGGIGLLGYYFYKQSKGEVS